MKREQALQTSLDQLMQYCESQDWQGYDPYDALDSPLIRTLSLRRRWFRLGFTQALKTLPFNLRKPLGIAKNINPKAVSLFLNSSLTLYRITRQEKYLRLARRFFDTLSDLSCQGYHGCAWGYSFDWQSRFFLLPKGTPTVVNTVFAANALINFHLVTGSQESLRMARSSCDFILQDLHRWEQGEEVCFSYTPLDTLQVYNANMLAAQLLDRVSTLKGEKQLRETALRAVNFVIRRQNADGSWFYGNKDAFRWIDGHHTGFILIALDEILKGTGRDELTSPLRNGLDFYRRALFRRNGAPKYYPGRRFPADIHCAAQGIITFARLRDHGQGYLGLAEKVARWTIENMQDRSGYFYFRKNRLLTNKIPYMRWGQAWMISALTELLAALAAEEEHS